MIKAVLKLIVFLAVIGFIGLVGYAYIGDLSPTTAQKTVTVMLDGK